MNYFRETILGEEVIVFWNHRVMQRLEGEENSLYVVEVYYHDDGGVLGWTDKEYAYGQNLEDVRQTLHWMLDALDKPVLVEESLLAKFAEDRENGETGLWEYDVITDEDRMSLDEVLDSLGLEREDIASWEDDGGRP